MFCIAVNKKSRSFRERLCIFILNYYTTIPALLLMTIMLIIDIVMIVFVFICFVIIQM